MHVDNTTEKVKNNLLLGLLDAMNIPGAEKRGQNELINSVQLPAKNNSYSPDFSAREMYEKMGIKVIGLSKGDNLFCDVELPAGWKKRSTGHSMWNELVDDKGRIRATFFYKAAFYDRDAFINFQRRFNINTVTYLPQEECGHYEEIEVKVEIEQPKRIISHFGDDMLYFEDDRGYVRQMFRGQKRYEIQKEKVWIPKFKNDYIKHNNTPHYFEITDSKKVIHSTKMEPAFFTRKYRKDRHNGWWKAYDKFQKDIRTQAENWLNERYPDWNDINSYWD